MYACLGKQEGQINLPYSYNNYFICDQIYGYCSIEINKTKTVLWKLLTLKLAVIENAVLSKNYSKFLSINKEKTLCFIYKKT